ncbi:MAG: hypothetical protein GY754_23885 [bacterium]|nr:hypothetical protein [bacterium]
MEEFTLKIFYLKKKVVFPYCTMTVIIGKSSLSDDIKKGNKLLTYPIRSVFDIFFHKKKLATLAEITDLEITEKFVKIQLKGLSRVKLKKINKFQVANFEFMQIEQKQVSEDLGETLRKKSQELIFLINVDESDRLINLLNFFIDLNQISDFIANYFILDFRHRYKIFNELDLQKRCGILIIILDKLIEEMKKKRDKELLAL